jgi:hypothetical protein
LSSFGSNPTFFIGWNHPDLHASTAINPTFLAAYRALVGLVIEM